MNGIVGPNVNKLDNEDPGATINKSMEDMYHALFNASQVCFIILMLFLLT